MARSLNSEQLSKGDPQTGDVTVCQIRVRYNHGTNVTGISYERKRWKNVPRASAAAKLTRICAPPNLDAIIYNGITINIQRI